MKRLEYLLLSMIMVGMVALSGCASPDQTLPPRHPGYRITFGSTSGSTSTPTLSTSSKPAENIPADKAVVYIYHSGGSNHFFILQANGKDVTGLKKGQYYAYVTEPGAIEFKATTRGTYSTTLDVKAGQAYYLQGSVPPGFSPTPSLVSVSPEVGAKEIAKYKLISGKTGKQE